MYTLECFKKRIQYEGKLNQKKHFNIYWMIQFSFYKEFVSRSCDLLHYKIGMLFDSFYILWCSCQIFKTPWIELENEGAMAPHLTQSSCSSLFTDILILSWGDECIFIIESFSMEQLLLKTKHEIVHDALHY